MRTLAVSLLAAAALGAGEDLGRVYRGKLEWEEGGLGRSWTAEPGDVWELERFAFDLGGELSIELGPSVAVFGAHDTGKGARAVVWAAVFPLDPAAGPKIEAAHPGHGDHVESLFLRFAPGRLTELFPPDSVVGPGDPSWLTWGVRVYARKINGHWQAENMPVVPWEHGLVFDAETVEGKRRCYMVDEKKDEVSYVGAFAERTIPDPPAREVTREEALAAFDETWSAFDREYAMFVVKPQVDWAALREVYRPIAAEARTSYEVAGAIGLLLGRLEDLHVWVRVEDDWVPGHYRMRLLNGHWPYVKERLGGLRETSSGVAWGELPGDLGYVVLWNLTSDGLVRAFDEALEALGETVGLVLDLRFNGGGDEELGKLVAGRFVDRARVYSVNQYRDGEAHDALGPKLERVVEPRGPWRYEAPVVVLQGQKTMSSAESLALMLAQCPQVTTMGDRTAGSSANPRRLEVGLGIVVNLPRWLDMDPDGRPIDGVGIGPAERVEATSYTEFRGADPVFDAALKLLEKKKGRKPGRRD